MRTWIAVCLALSVVITASAGPKPKWRVAVNGVRCTATGIVNDATVEATLRLTCNGKRGKPFRRATVGIYCDGDFPNGWITAPRAGLDCVYLAALFNDSWCDTLFNGTFYPADTFPVENPSCPVIEVHRLR